VPFIRAMRILVPSLAALAVCITQRADCQQRHALVAGVERASSSEIGTSSETPPSPLIMGLKGVGVGYAGGLFGGTAGLLVDDRYCQRRHRGEPSGLLGPCTFYTGAGTLVGWFGGAALGAAIGAKSVARKRGCPRDSAFARALLGGMLGSAPGAAIVAAGPEKYPTLRSGAILVTPLLAGLGATAAVVGCHAPG
jgi:hypothetical protein